VNNMKPPTMSPPRHMARARAFLFTGKRIAEPAAVVPEGLRPLVQDDAAGRQMIEPKWIRDLYICIYMHVYILVWCIVF